MFATDAEELKPLHDVLDVLAGWDPGLLDDESLTAHLVAARRERDRLDAVIARLAAAYLARQAWAREGARSPAGHLAQQAGEPVEGCRADLRLARALVGMPATAAALADGRISRAHAERLVRAAGGPRAGAFAEAEGMLLGLAARLDGDDFERALRYWVQLADDSGAETEARHHDRARWCALDQTPDGRWHLQATLTRTAGAEFAAALRRIDDQLFRADWQRAREALGREPSVADLERTALQRRHDALVVLARRAHAAPPGARLPRPFITLHINAETAFGRLCELADGTVITPGEALPLFSVGDLERAVFDTPDRVRVSEHSRLFRGAERRAVEIRDRYCTYDGCHEPAEHCDVDHVIPYDLGGPTRQDNGRLRCPTHHPGRRHHQPWLTPPEPEPDDTS